MNYADTLPQNPILDFAANQNFVVNDKPIEMFSVIIAVLLFLFLVCVSIYDIKYHKIENYTHLVIIVAAFFINDLTIAERLTGGIACFLPFLIVNLISKNGIGMGDVKLVGAFGFALGIYGGIYSAVAGLCLMLITAGIYQFHTKTKEAVPLAPYLCTAFSTALFMQIL